MSVDRILRDGALDWQAVRRQYNRRVQISQRLNRLLNEKRSADFASVALGISDPDGSYSPRLVGVYFSRESGVRFQEALKNCQFTCLLTACAHLNGFAIVGERSHLASP
jgi:hypothetical protein